MKVSMRKQKLINGGVRILSALFLVFITAAVVLYQKGYYDFTFIERPHSAPSETGSVQTETVTTGKNEETEAPVHTGVAVSDTTPVIPPPDEMGKTAAEVLLALPTLENAEAEGYEAQSGGTYDATWQLARVPLAYDNPLYSYSKYRARSLRVIEYNRNCIVTSEIYRNTARPAVMAKNGYLIVDNEGVSLSLYDANGTLLLENYGEKAYALTELRTKDGRAIFMHTEYETQLTHKPIMIADEYTGRPKESGRYEDAESEVTVEVYTYFTLKADGTFATLDASVVDEAKKKGVIFDAPTDYGTSESNIEVYKNEYSPRYGYRDKTTGKPILYATYLWAHEFRDGYGICSDGRELFVINEQGETVYSVGCQDPDIFFTVNEMTYPDTNGIEALGCYYFDHGLTRVRMRPNLITYAAYYYIKTDDYTTLIDINGNEFEIPGGYTLEGYSDGILLLKKKGENLYGYMSYRGEWIVEPEYSYARPFVMGLGVIGKNGTEIGIVDTNGDLVVPMVFDYISDISKGSVAMHDAETGWSVCLFMAKDG